MKKHILTSKYLWLLLSLLSIVACNEPDDVLADYNVLPAAPEELPALTAGSANFSKYVAIGATFTAGFTDGALFKASQQNSFPSILAGEFAKAGGGSFTQPMMNDNFGGLALAGTRIQDPRLVFGGAGPVSLESIIGPVTVTTDIALNNPTGPFNNLGVPGAKSYHLFYNGFGNIANLPSAANPYFVRMTGATPNASVMDLAMAQNPTFFTLSEIGGNDVLGYATSGGTGVDQTGNSDPSTYGNNDITDPTVFASVLNNEVALLTSGGAKGLITNVPYITDLPHFTTVPYNPIPLDGATADFLNSASAYGAYNAGVQQALAYLVSVNAITQQIADAELAKRTIHFEASETNAVVIMDEDLIDLTAINPALISMRQATEDDLFVLPAASFIGTEAVPNNPQTVNGVAIPLADKWVLTPEEQAAIKTATDAYNSTIEGIASSNASVGLVDLKGILSQLASTGYAYGDYILTADLVTGGAVSLDGIHLTARGYALMAGAFLDAIDANFGSNFAASGNIPDASMYGTNYSPTLQ
ncbi:G-D-S-L family lipolytic protein [Gaetbulibacter aestuarii]|uniref:G-D-S-L family lipolytic protein n=1 Tax=Gaetbulibacter aestuarii TaxID=1502358 RepID=A0ABW7MVK5_9FLAO